MANSYFVVHNGLTVGPLTIDAATGDINTSGNVNISGSVGVSQIAKNDSFISINDTGSGSSVVIQIDGATEHTVDSSGVNLAADNRFAIAGNLIANTTTLGGTVVDSSLRTLGNLTALSVSGSTSLFGPLSTNAILFANAGIASSGTASGALVVAGGAGISGNLNVGSSVNVTNSLFVAGAQTATLADATALAIALGG